jgi:hypothetical protein
MAHWTTLFVEVPLSTFNPVKTVSISSVHSIKHEARPHPVQARWAYMPSVSCISGTTSTGHGVVAMTALQMRPVINRLSPVNVACP